jgi:hypothetical protein
MRSRPSPRRGVATEGRARAKKKKAAARSEAGRGRSDRARMVSTLEEKAGRRASPAANNHIACSLRAQ